MKGLPAESALARAHGAPLPGDWTNADELLAVLAELAHAQILLTLRINTEKGTRLPEPLTIPRPYVDAEETKPKLASPEEIRRFFGARGRVQYTPKETKT